MQQAGLTGDFGAGVSAVQQAGGLSEEQIEKQQQFIARQPQNDTLKYLLNTVVHKIEPELQVTLGQDIDTEVKILVKDKRITNSSYTEVFKVDLEEPLSTVSVVPAAVEPAAEPKPELVKAAPEKPKEEVKKVELPKTVAPV